MIENLLKQSREMVQLSGWTLVSTSSFPYHAPERNIASHEPDDDGSRLIPYSDNNSAGRCDGLFKLRRESKTTHTLALASKRSPRICYSWSWTGKWREIASFRVQYIKQAGAGLFSRGEKMKAMLGGRRFFLRNCGAFRETDQLSFSIICLVSCDSIHGEGKAEPCVASPIEAGLP